MQRWMQACLVAMTLFWGGLASAAPNDAPPGEAVEAPAKAKGKAAKGKAKGKAKADAPAEAKAEADAEAQADAPPPTDPPDGEEAFDAEAGEEELELEEEPNPWTAGLLSSMIALGIGGIAAVLGIWVDRDQSRPVVFAGAMSVLISSAIFVGMVQSYLDAVGAIQARADLDRMLDMVEEISADSDDPALAAMLEKENKRRGRKNKRRADKAE